MFHMKVAFNARTLSTHQLRGWSRYFSNLVRELSFLDLELFLFSDRKINQDLLNGCRKENLKIIEKKGFFYFDWEQRVLPQLCQEYKIDVLHCPINYGLPRFSSCRQVLTLHDVIDIAVSQKSSSNKQKKTFASSYIQWLHKIAVQSSDKIITVSEYSKRDILESYNLSGDKVKVIYEAADPVFHNKSGDFNHLEEKFHLKDPYLFYVGGFEERKNIDFLLRAFAHTKGNYKLLLAGGGSERERLIGLSNQLKLQNRVQFLGWVEDVDLCALYQKARAFVYPSLYEGFGLQITEAMAMGCPVLCSNQTSLPEIWGYEKSCFDPRNADKLTQLMDQCFEDESFYKSLKEWTQKRNQDFSWKKTAEETLKIYQTL